MTGEKKAARKTTAGGGRWIKFAIAAVFITAIVAFFGLGGRKYLSLETIQANRDALLAFTDEHFVAAVAIAFAVYVVATAFSLPGALLLSLTMGFVFGRWVGTALVVISATVGATIVFLAARYLFADWARKRMGTLGEKINAGFTDNAFNLSLIHISEPTRPY